MPGSECFSCLRDLIKNVTVWDSAWLASSVRGAPLFRDGLLGRRWLLTALAPGNVFGGALAGRAAAGWTGGRGRPGLTSQRLCLVSVGQPDGFNC